MKKFAPIVAIVVISGLFASCKKDFTCTCKDNTGAQDGQFKYTKTKKKTAKAACDGWNTLAAIDGGSCSLD